MKRKIVVGMLVASMIAGVTLCYSETAYSSESDEIKITRKVNQYLYNANSVGSDVIEMYEEGGWAYNPDENYFVRTVTYINSPIVVDGDEYTTDEDGVAEINVNQSDVVIESLTGMDKVTFNLKDCDDEIVVVENISVNNVMKTMDMLDILNSDEYDGDFEIGQNDGEKPKKGDIVACNRFNGYLGNGKYYSSQIKPQAIANFFSSDCDWALGSYPDCLMDEQPVAEWRYCSLVSKSHYGKCSALAKKANGKSHSKYFHMHTGFKS